MIKIFNPFALLGAFKNLVMIILASLIAFSLSSLLPETQKEQISVATQSLSPAIKKTKKVARKIGILAPEPSFLTKAKDKVLYSIRWLFEKTREVLGASALKIIDALIGPIIVLGVLYMLLVQPWKTSNN